MALFAILREAPKTGELAEAVVALRDKPVADSSRQPQTIVIDQENFRFTPETAVIRRGDSVKFTNADQTTHNVQASGDIATFNSNMPGGGDFTVRFDKAGGVRQPVTIGCVFHSAMRAWIFVFDHPWYAANAGQTANFAWPTCRRANMTWKWCTRPASSAGKARRSETGRNTAD